MSDSNHAPSVRPWRALAADVARMNAYAWATVLTAWLAAALVGLLPGDSPPWARAVLSGVVVLVVVMVSAGVWYGEGLVFGTPLVVAALVGLFLPEYWPVMLALAVLPAIGLSVGLAVRELARG